MLQEVDISVQPVPSSPRLLAALRDGFFFVRHAISATLLDEAYGLLGEFLSLPPGDKASCRVPGTNGQAGYTPPLIETAEAESQPDWKELFHWGRPLPVGHPLRARYPRRYPDPYFPDGLIPDMRSTLTRLHTELFDLQSRTLSVIAVGLGLHETYFLDMVEDGPVVNRATWYPPMSAAPSAQHVWAGEHLDFDLITALPRATSSGLEVLIEDRWVGVTPQANYAVINAGMVLERLTNGLIPAARHRVRAPGPEHAGRLSIVQFCHPTPWTVLTPIAPPGASSGPVRFATLAADDLFTQTMYRINRLERAPNGADPTT